MESRLIDLSKYRLNRAREDLKTSQIDFDNHQFAASMNRSYYAIFHAIRAVNSLEGFDSRKHAGVIAYFNQYFLKTGRISNSRKMSEIIKDARRFREKSDYEDFFIAARDDAEEQLQNANLFVETIGSFLEEFHHE